MAVEWEGVTAGEGMSLVMTGDSVFTVLDVDDVVSCVLCVFMPL